MSSALHPVLRILHVQLLPPHFFGERTHYDISTASPQTFHTQACLARRRSSLNAQGLATTKTRNTNQRPTAIHVDISRLGWLGCRMPSMTIDQKMFPCSSAPPSTLKLAVPAKEHRLRLYGIAAVLIYVLVAGVEDYDGRGSRLVSSPERNEGC